MKNKIEMILCDKDGTLVEYSVPPHFSSWDGLSLALSEEKQKEWISIRDFYVSKIDLYDEWFSKQVKLLKGLPVSEAEKVLFPVPYSKGVKNFFGNLNGRYKKGIVSSGIDIVAKKVLEELNFDFFITNILETENGFFNGEGVNAVGLKGKAIAVEKVSNDYGIPLEKICFIGDSFNDVSVFEIVGLPIAFKPKLKEVQKRAKYVIDDFTELNKILEAYEY
ncbi:MAG: HAD family phosphatase [Nanoarchaeota archaeon]